MRIPAKIAEYLGRGAESRLGIHDPPLLEKGIDKNGESLRACEWGDRTGEDKLPLLECLAQSVHELGSKNGAEHLHRQEEGVLRVNPPLVVCGESACRDHAVHMRMQE